VSYAASDALAAVLIFLSMVTMKSSGSSDDNSPSLAARAKSFCQGVVDLKYSSAKAPDSRCPSDKVSNVNFIVIVLQPKGWIATIQYMFTHVYTI